MSNTNIFCLNCVITCYGFLTLRYVYSPIELHLTINIHWQYDLTTLSKVIFEIQTYVMLHLWSKCVYYKKYVCQQLCNKNETVWMSL